MRVVSQLSVFLENEPGRLAKMCDELSKRDINILAMSVGDTADYAVVRVVVDNPADATHLLGEAGILVVENDVIMLALENRIGALGDIADQLAEAGINIDYAYGTVSEEQVNGVLVIRTQEPERAIEVLS